MQNGDPFLPTSLNGWLAAIGQILTAAIMAGGALWALIREKHKGWVETEGRDRKQADSNIERKVEQYNTRVEEMARDVHNYMGKTDLMQLNLHAAEVERVKEMAALREELRTGFATLKGMLGNSSHYRRGDDQ